jgi:hypothetical protein
MVLSKKMTIIAMSNKYQNHIIMKKTALLIVFALFTLILAMGDLAQAQVIITPTNPESPSYSSSQTSKTVYKCNSCTTCTINKNNELVNCTETLETTTFVLDVTPDNATITIIKPLKKRKYNIDYYDIEEVTGTLELNMWDDSGPDYKAVTITIFGSDNLISVQTQLGMHEYDITWDDETAMSRIGGTMEIYTIEQ